MPCFFEILMVDLPLHLNFPRVNPLFINTDLVQMPIERVSFIGSNFLIHLHNFSDNILEEECNDQMIIDSPHK